MLVKPLGSRREVLSAPPRFRGPKGPKKEPSKLKPHPQSFVVEGLVV